MQSVANLTSSVNKYGHGDDLLQPFPIYLLQTTDIRNRTSSLVNFCQDFIFDKRINQTLLTPGTTPSFTDILTIVVIG